MTFYPDATRMLAPVRTVAPTVPILTVEELQAHLRVDGNYDYDVVTSLLFVATQYLDGMTGVTGQCLITQTWTASWDSFPWSLWHGTERNAMRAWPVSSSQVIRLPIAPIQSLTSVTYYDTNNASQTLSAANYGLYRDGQGWFVQLNQNQSWPSTYQRPDAVTATMVAGYGSTASTVPLPIRLAAKMLISNWYENRMSTGQTTAEVDALLAPFKRNWVH